MVGIKTLLKLNLDYKKCGKLQKKTENDQSFLKVNPQENSRFASHHGISQVRSAHLRQEP